MLGVRCCGWVSVPVPLLRHRACLYRRAPPARPPRLRQQGARGDRPRPAAAVWAPARALPAGFAAPLQAGTDLVLRGALLRRRRLRYVPLGALHLPRARSRPARLSPSPLRARRSSSPPAPGMERLQVEAAALEEYAEYRR